MEELKSLNELYPNLGAELENRHSAHYSSIRRRFGKIYQDLEPHYFVSAKGTTTLLEISGTPLKISMALENGVVLAVAATYPSSDVYINTAEHHEEVVLTHKGEVKHGESEFATTLSEAYQAALSHYPVTKLKGGIIYFDANIRKEAEGYWEAVKLGIAAAALLINNFKGDSLKELEDRAAPGKNCRVSLTAYKNGQMLCGDHSQAEQHSLVSSPVSLDNNTLLFCDITLPADQEGHLRRERQAMHAQLWELESIASALLKQHPIEVEDSTAVVPHSLLYLLKSGNLADLAEYLPQPMVVTQQEQTQQASSHSRLLRRLQTFLKQYESIASLSHGVTTDLLRQALNHSTQNSLQHNMYPPLVHRLLAMCGEYEALAATFSHSNQLIVLCNRKKMLNLFDALKKELIQSIEHVSNYEEKHPVSTMVKKMLFSSLPSNGCGVLNPTSELWYM